MLQDECGKCHSHPITPDRWGAIYHCDDCGHTWTRGRYVNTTNGDMTYRPLSGWERERWREIVHACTSRPGGVEFGPQAKAVILAVARELEATQEQLSGERLGRKTAEGARDAALVRCQELEAEIAELNGFIQKRIDPHSI